MNIFVVIPTIRNLDFLEEWKEQFRNCSLLVVEDHADQEIETPKGRYRAVYHYTWKNIREDFGKDEWIFSRKNAGIRSYGFWKAYTLKADIVITLDDDCYPVDSGFVQTHVKNLQTAAPDGWFPTFPHPDFCYTRGFPYKNRSRFKVVMSHGLWSNKMDLDGQTQLKHLDVNIPSYPPMRQYVPFGYFFPMSSMNLAFTRDIIPLMYFPLMGYDSEGKPWGVDRFDDIWAGIISKKILDHLHLAVTNGSPFVEHRKASDPQINIRKEKVGIRVNEWLWKEIDRVVLKHESVVDCLRELYAEIKPLNDTYFSHLKKAVQIWSDLFHS